MPFEALDDPAGFSGFERFIQRCWCVGIQIVLNQHDLFGIREVDVAQITQDICIVDGRAPRGDLDMAPAFERTFIVSDKRSLSGANSMKRLAVPLRLYS